MLASLTMLFVNRIPRIAAFAAVLATATITLIAGDAQGATARATPTGFVATSKTMEITVDSGAITRVVNRITGELHTTSVTGSAWMPRGVLCIDSASSPSLKAVQILHIEWGSTPIYGTKIDAGLARVARGPNASSTLQTTRTASGIRCVWRGLSDGVTTYPNDLLTIDAVIDDNTGQIELTASATTETSDVVGVMVPMVNLSTRHALYVPSFGGMCYQPADLAASKLNTLSSAPFVEAPVLVAEGSSGSIAMWVEDPLFRPYATFFGGEPTSTAMGIEAINDMPFEGKHFARAAKWRLGAFRGTWPAATAPYRSWYARAMGPEIAARESRGWPAGISVIVDRVGSEPNALSRLSKLLDPTKVLIHDWYPRQAAFDTQLPEWNPTSSFISMVQAAHTLGFKAMGYVNAFCVNYNSPAFIRDNLANSVLPRTISSISRYGDARKTLASCAPNELIYVDPVRAAWRKYHVNSMINWRAATGADANYEDTGGTAGDFGNGSVDGLRGAQGGWAQFRDLQQANPVPMATEFGPDNIAFASSWALRYSQAWGTPEIRKFWETHHRPMSAALFGTGARAWVPTIVAETEQQKWTVVACSDALGGVAQLEATNASFDARAGMARHMVDRALIFSQLGLVPCVDAWPRDASVVSQFRDKSGKIYQYRVQNGVQELAIPGSTPLYQRVTGKTSIASALRIPGWPGVTSTGNIGLLPTAVYALAPSTAAPATAARIDVCPAGYSISRYVETADFALITFAPNGGATGSDAIGVIATTNFVDAILSDASGAIVRRNAPLASGERMDLRSARPAALLLLRRAVNPVPTPSGTGGSITLATTPVLGKYVSDTTGIERGGTFVSPSIASFTLSGYTTTTPFRFAAGGGDSEVAFDNLLMVSGRDSAVEFTVRNTQKTYGDGCICRAYINGKLVFSEDLGPRADANGVPKWDTTAHVCRVPVGATAGRPIVFTIAIWGKGNSNADEIWLSEARLVNDTAQSAYATVISAVP